MLKGIALAWLPLVIMVGLIVFNGDGEGIYDVGANKDAVYLAGEACVINMGLDKPEQDMIEELNSCIRIHRTYVNK